MALTQDQIKANIDSMQEQGAKDSDIQGWLDSLKGQDSQAQTSNQQQAAPATPDKPAYDESAHFNLDSSLDKFAADKFSQLPQNLNIPARVEANAAQSVDDYATQKGQRGLGLPFPITGQDVATPANLPTIAAKGVANALPALAYSAADVGTFLWNVNNHPINSAIKILSDPVTFAGGLLGDAITQPLSGLAQGANDLATGKGGKQALQDAAAGVKKGAVAFFDDPITSILQTKFAKDFVEEPITTTKKMVDSATKPLQKVAGTVADTAANIKDNGLAGGISAQVKDMSSAFSNKLAALKTGLSMFTKDGTAKVTGAATQESFGYAKAFFDVQNYQDQLKNADVNTPEYNDLTAKLGQAQRDLQVSQENLKTMGFGLIKQQKETFDGGGFDNHQAATDALSQKVSELNAQKDQTYQQAYNKPDGSPIQVNDTTPLVDALNNRANTMGRGGFFSGTVGALRDFANALDLRQKISSAGGFDEYVQSLVDAKTKAGTVDGKYTSGEGYAFDPTKNPELMSPETEKMRQDTEAEVYKQMQSTGRDNTFFEKPMTAQELSNSWTQFYKRTAPGSNETIGYQLGNDQGGSSVMGAKEQVLKDSIEPVNPGGYKYKTDADALWKQHDEAAKTFDGKNFSSLDDLGNFAAKNWDAVKRLAPDLLLKLQNTLVSHVMTQAINESTGEVDYGVIQKGLAKYGDILNSFQQQVLKTGSLVPDLGKATVDDPKIAATLKPLSDQQTGITAKQEEINTLEQQTKDAAAKQKAFGTSPNETIGAIEGIKDSAGLQAFMDASGIKDPKEVGKMYLQSLYENKFPIGLEEPSLDSLIDTAKQAQELGRGTNSHTDAPKIQSTFYDPKTIQSLKDIQGLAERAKELQNVEGMSTAKRLLSLGLTGLAVTVGWHGTAIASMMKALSPVSVGETGEPQITSTSINKAMAELKQGNQSVGNLKSIFLRLAAPAQGGAAVDKKENGG
jgi:hypothetical protein